MYLCILIVFVTYNVVEHLREVVSTTILIFSRQVETQINHQIKPSGSGFCAQCDLSNVNPHPLVRLLFFGGGGIVHASPSQNFSRLHSPLKNVSCLPLTNFSRIPSPPSSSDFVGVKVPVGKLASTPPNDYGHATALAEKVIQV